MSEAGDPLYRKALLRLAADATGAGHLPAPDAAASAANPACGDQVTVEITLDGDCVCALAHDTKACILTQASAAILGAAAPGRNRAALAALETGVRAMLKDGAPPPLPDYAAFDGAAALPGRHVCVLLPFQALRDALELAEPGGQRPEVQTGR
jgi:NifU-like protein involved in Fe-S cluster formation